MRGKLKGKMGNENGFFGIGIRIEDWGLAENPATRGTRREDGVRSGDVNFLPLLAIFLLIVWVVARIVFAITGFFLHILWIIALIMLALWVIGKIRGSFKG